jgi:hypothetical protein
MALDQSCKKNEKLFFELREELNMDDELNIEVNLGAQGGNKTSAIADYIKDF